MWYERGIIVNVVKVCVLEITLIIVSWLSLGLLSGIKDKEPTNLLFPIECEPKAHSLIPTQKKAVGASKWWGDSFQLWSVAFHC